MSIARFDAPVAPSRLRPALLGGLREHDRPGRHVQLCLQGARRREVRLGVGHYHNALQNNLPAQRRGAPTPLGCRRQPAAVPARRAPRRCATSARSTRVDEQRGSRRRAVALGSRASCACGSSPGRTPIATYDQSYVYVQVDSGRWLIDHAQRADPRSLRAGAPAASVPTAGWPRRAAAPSRPPAARSRPSDATRPITQALRALHGAAPPASRPTTDPDATEPPCSPRFAPALRRRRRRGDPAGLFGFGGERGVAGRPVRRAGCPTRPISTTSSCSSTATASASCWRSCRSPAPTSAWSRC